MRGWVNRCGMVLCGLIGGMAFADAASAQCSVQIRERFKLGPRQVGGNGNLRDVFIGDGLGGVWAESSIPAGRRWMTAQVDTGGWAFGASNYDPYELAEDPFGFGENGIAFGQGLNDALIAITQPSSGRLTLQVHGMQFWDLTRSLSIGFSSSSSLLVNNLASFGQMWIELYGNDDYALWVQGNPTPLATGAIDWGFFSATGFLRVELTYDATANTVSATIGVEELGPFPLVFTPKLSFAGMEANESDGIPLSLNNFAVITGDSPAASATGVTATTVCAGGSVTLSATTNATGPVQYFWHHKGGPLQDGPHVSGALMDQVELSGLSAALSGEYTCVMLTECGVIESAPVVVSVNLAADINQDGMVNGADLSVLLGGFGGLSVPGFGADLNGDGLVDGRDLSVLLGQFGTAC